MQIVVLIRSRNDTGAVVPGKDERSDDDSRFLQIGCPKFLKLERKSVAGPPRGPENYL